MTEKIYLPIGFPQEHFLGVFPDIQNHKKFSATKVYLFRRQKMTD